MTEATSALKDVLGLLFSAGFAVGPENQAPAPDRVQLRPAPDVGGLPLVVCPSSTLLREQLLEALQQGGYRVTEKPGDLLELASTEAADLLLQFQLPIRLKTLNPQLRIHWAKKGTQMQDLAWMVLASVPPGDRPRMPLQNIDMEIDRFSTQEPDEENLNGCAKWIRDVLQPMHPTLRPYGLGFILEDAKWCVHHLRVKHVQSREHRTDVRIYRSNQAVRSAS